MVWPPRRERMEALDKGCSCQAKTARKQACKASWSTCGDSFFMASIQGFGTFHRDVKHGVELHGQVQQTVAHQGMVNHAVDQITPGNIKLFLRPQQVKQRAAAKG